MFLEESEQPYVLALSGKQHVRAGFHQHRVSKYRRPREKGSCRRKKTRKKVGGASRPETAPNVPASTIGSGSH